MYKNYQKVLNYSHLEGQKNHFHSKNAKSNVEKTSTKLMELRDIVEDKKNKMLIDENNV